MLPAPVVAQAVPGEEAVLGALARARLAEDSGDARQALAALIVVANRVPDLPGLRARMLEQAIEVGDLAAARSAAGHLWEAGERRIDAQLVLVADAMRRSDWRAARDYLAGRTGKGGLDPIARLIEPPLNAWVAMGAREARPERYALETGSRAAPQPAFQFEAGLVQVAARRTAEAVAIAERVTPTDRTSQLVAMRLAAALDGAGEREAAARLRGRVALAAGGREDPALLLPDQGVPGARSGAAHWLGLLADGFSRTPGGNPKIPLMFARVATWIDPADWQARAALVEALDLNGQKQAALAALASGRTPLPPVLAMRRAELLADEGGMTDALTAAEAAVAGAAPARSLLIRYADIARRSDDPRAAERAYLRLEADLGEGEFDRAVRANILIARAELLLQADDWDAAAPLLDGAVALRPDDPNVLNFVGYSSIERRRDIPRSLERIEAAWAQDPQNAAITDSLGWAYFLVGRIDEAVPLLERAQRGEPGNAVIVEHLGDAYWKAGEHFRARHTWRAAALVAEADMAARLEAKLRDGLTAATTAP